MSNGPSGTGELSARQVGPLAGELRTSSPTGAAQSTASPAKGPEPAPPQPMTLEQQKLKAEIDEIQFRTKPPGKLDRLFSTPVRNLTGIVTLGAAVIAGFIQWNEYRDQRERLARFEVGEEVIKLATQLNDRTNSETQSLAAYELAWFGRPAALLLFEQLIFQERDNLQAAIIVALAEIARSDRETPGVPVLLAQSTQTYVNATLNDDATEFEGIEQHLKALVMVAAVIGNDDDDAASYRAILGTIREAIDSQPAARVPDEAKAKLRGIIDRGLQPSDQ